MYIEGITMKALVLLWSVMMIFISVVVCGMDEDQQFELSSVASSSHMSSVVFKERINVANKDLRECDVIESIEGFNTATKLDVSHNRIERFNVKELIRLMPHLKDINFSHNCISKLRRCMLEGLPDGSYLDLSHNPINQVGKGVERAIAGLRDKDITISMYGTHLDVSVCESLEKSTYKSALRHTCLGVGLMVLGGLTLGGSCVLAIVSHPQDNEVRTAQERVMIGGAVSGMILGYCLTAVKHVITIFKHDCHQSRLYWYKHV